VGTCSCLTYGHGLTETRVTPVGRECPEHPRVYLCHECGGVLDPSLPSTMFYCRRCRKRRRMPTHPALIVG
jgi:hypothetical protein